MPVVGPWVGPESPTRPRSLTTEALAAGAHVAAGHVPAGATVGTGVGLTLVVVHVTVGPTPSRVTVTLVPVVGATGRFTHAHAPGSNTILQSDGRGAGPRSTLTSEPLKVGVTAPQARHRVSTTSGTAPQPGTWSGPLPLSQHVALNTEQGLPAHSTAPPPQGSAGHAAGVRDQASSRHPCPHTADAP